MFHIKKFFKSKKEIFLVMPACLHAQSLQFCLTLCCSMDVAPQASWSMGFSRQEHWSGLPCPPSGDLPDAGVESTAPVPRALAGRFFTAEPPGKPGLCLSLH